MSGERACLRVHVAARAEHACYLLAALDRGWGGLDLLIDILDLIGRKSAEIDIKQKGTDGDENNANANTEPLQYFLYHGNRIIEPGGY
jgi:hypothetical protein